MLQYVIDIPRDLAMPTAFCACATSFNITLELTFTVACDLEKGRKVGKFTFLIVSDNLFVSVQIFPCGMSRN